MNITKPELQRIVSTLPTVEQDFVAKCSELRITTRLDHRSDPTQHHVVWVRNNWYHGAFVYCGCSTLFALHIGRDAYSVCEQHHLQSLGKLVAVKRHTSKWHTARLMREVSS